MTRIEAAVAKWDIADYEAWVHRSGMHLHNGESRDLADQKAYMELSKIRRLRAPSVPAP